MGGLLSAHLLASDPSTGMAVDGYKGKLLELAEDLGRRMLPAFLTPTGRSTKRKPTFQVGCSNVKQHLLRNVNPSLLKHTE